MAETRIVSRGNVMLKRRSVAPGEVELAIVATLQFVAALALTTLPPRLLTGNGTALMTLSAHPSLGVFAKMFWAIVFTGVGIQCVRAIRHRTVEMRKWAWQLVIPLWAMWLAGFTYPVFVGLQTNVIVLALGFALVSQWLVARFLVPLDSHWYDREVPLVAQVQMGETASVVARSGGRLL